MNPRAEALKARTRKFMLDCLSLCKTIERSPEGDVLRRQLAKSACGVAGNYRHTCRARSHAEFVAKLGITLEESDESELWLGTIRDAKLSAAPTLQERRAILYAATKTVEELNEAIETLQKLQ